MRTGMTRRKAYVRAAAPGAAQPAASAAPRGRAPSVASTEREREKARCIDLLPARFGRERGAAAVGVAVVVVAVAAAAAASAACWSAAAIETLVRRVVFAASFC